ncbi:NAD(P)/FAD-dependent oxidoreductase, partial [Candidatus Pacearchaeota archaeon]|nr:NAD(P)/FAD-dependent oxidoreductase [Candidatus Pacearchaeota archaeon]
MISTVIVGAGPAGSTTAKAILNENPDHEVTIIDRYKEPWSKVQCAGGMSLPLLEEMGIKVPDNIITSKTERVILCTPNETLEINGKSFGRRFLGLTVDRAAFDKWLLDEAIKAGVNVSLATQAKGMDINTHEGEQNINLKLSTGSMISADFLVGADGANSMIGKWSGIQNGTKEMHVGYQETWEMPDYPQETMMMWFNTKWAPEGYCWAFPDGNGRVRMGIGIPTGIGNLKNYFNKFVADCDDLFKEFGRVPGVRTNRIGGLISTEAPLKSCVNDFGNIALVGCAGNHT